ncbi:MAG: hypothetical protein P8Z35_14735, partial [Ignavibacteriaceae bacterium]
LLLVLISFFSFCMYLYGQPNKILKAGPSTENLDLTKYSNVIYISQAKGSDKDGNGSKSNPWNTIIYALNQVTENTVNSETALIVAEGTYSYGTIQMKSYVDILGGFNETNWDRDIYKYKTIIDGNYSRRIVIGADNARIDGCTIKKGISRYEGGGILCDDTSPEISNCFIVDNYTLEPENFNNTRIHQKGNEGGGIACLYNATPVIRNNIFYKNRTSIGDGGALSFYGWVRQRHGTDRRIENNFMEGSGRAKVLNNVFIQNTAGVNDIYRTRSSNGGAISCSNEARPIIENNVIVSNRAKGNSDAGGIYVEDFSYPTIKDNWIVGDVSDDDGGGMYIMRLSHALVENNFIAGNWTTGGGAGGIRLSKEGRATINNNVIVYNQSGGAVQCIDSYMELKNNILMHNKGKISIRYTNTFSYFIPSIVENNIIQDNTGKIDLELRKGEEINFKNNNTKDTAIGSNNSYSQIPFEDNLISGRIKNHYFNESHYQTVIETDSGNNEKSLIGRVIHIGNFWSVITQVKDNKINFWGNISVHDLDLSEFQILPSYNK